MASSIFRNRVEGHPGIGLNRAMACAECNTISDISSLIDGGRCPHCESVAVAPIANWLNRPDIVANGLAVGTCHDERLKEMVRKLSGVTDVLTRLTPAAARVLMTQSEGITACLQGYLFHTKMEGLHAQR